MQNAPASAVTTTDPNYHYIINQPGSYYLTSNIPVSKANGVQINAAGVMLDLNGFQVARTSGSGGLGIALNAHHCTVRNGPVSGFNAGVYSGGSGTHGCMFRDLGVSGCSQYGIQAGIGAVIESCRAHDNGPYSGTGVSSAIAAGPGSIVNNCTVDHNTNLLWTLFADNGSSISNCSASFNNSPGDYGIYANGGSSLVNCTAYNNTVGTAIITGDGCSLINCVAYKNTAGTGIFCDPGCGLTNCNSSENTSADANSYGFYINGAGSTLLGCTARANTTTSASPGTLNAVGIYADVDTTLKSCAAVSNKGDGIHTAARVFISDCAANSNGNGANGSGIVTDVRAVVRNCSASNNQKSGIVVLGGSSVAANSVSSNGIGGSVSAAGIDSSGGSGSDIEGNYARDNAQAGIRTNASGLDLVIRNNVGGGSGTAYNPQASNNMGALQSPNNAVNPMANTQF